MGVMQSVLSALAEDLKKCGDLDLQECFINGTLVLVRTGLRLGKTKLNRVRSGMRGNRLVYSCQLLINSVSLS